MAAKPRLSKNLLIAVSDGDSVTKVTLFEEFAGRVAKGNSYIIRGYSLRGQLPSFYISISRETLFFKTAPMDYSPTLEAEAEALLNPPSAVTHLRVTDFPGFITARVRWWRLVNIIFHVLCSFHILELLIMALLLPLTESDNLSCVLSS